MHDEFSDVFIGIVCFKGTFSSQIKDDVKHYQVLSRYVAYKLQELFRKILERLQKHQIMTLLGVDEMVE